MKQTLLTLVTVLADAEAAGFVLAGQSDISCALWDDHSENVLDPAIRGKTDRFVKPE